VKKLLPWIALAIALFWILGNPTGAAADIRHAITGLANFVHGL
jgi:hypothetical protein